MECNHCNSLKVFKASLKTRRVIRRGYFPRKGDGKRVPRYWCKKCCRRFSAATFSDTRYLKKRGYLNAIRENLICTNSLRRTAKMVGLDIGSVMRRLPIIGVKCDRKNKKFLEKIMKDKKFNEVWFDELETFEKTKLTPLAVQGVCTKERIILGVKVAIRPPDEIYREKSEKKYGKIKDYRPDSIRALFSEVSEYVIPSIKVTTDKATYYHDPIRSAIPQFIHDSHYARRSRPNGLGEMKVGGFDPLFPINQVFAMFRANISRLARQTWCTTKKQANLMWHILIFVEAHNRYAYRLAVGAGRDMGLV